VHKVSDYVYHISGNRLSISMSLKLFFVVWHIVLFPDPPSFACVTQGNIVYLSFSSTSHLYTSVAIPEFAT